MIFYFTGTGNSLWVAKELSRNFNEPLISLADELQKEGELMYQIEEDENIFFVFPVHSWGPAIPVVRFISRLTLKGYTDQFIYSVSTCGDECGHTDKIIRKKLSTRGLRLSAAYSVQMPNNYILLPGFNVDTKEVEQMKLVQAPKNVYAISETIKTNGFTHLYKRGGLPFLKSRMIYPLFVRFAVKQDSFRVTDACISCSICEEICPTKTISTDENGRPKWKPKTCVQCLACIHYCPVKAIEYGSVSVKKGRYHHPQIKNNK